MRNLLLTIKKLRISPNIYILMMVLLLFTIKLLQYKNLGSYGDFFVYNNIVQSLSSGSILYKTAIDTKNMGFFAIFYFLYKPYSLIFATMEYFFLVQAFFLTFLYWGIGILVYKIVELIWDQKIALFTTFLTLSFLATTEYVYFINQPQIALFCYLLLIYILLKTQDNQSLKNFFIYGLLLGLTTVMTTPYIFLTLIIPIISFIKYREEKNTFLFIQRCLISFAGFILVWMPFFLYFLVNDALLDWFYWNWSFSTSSYTSGDNNNRLLNTLLGMLWKNQHTILIPVPSAISHFAPIIAVFSAWFLALFVPDKYFSKKQILLMIIISLSLLTRLTLVRGYLSYNIYIAPCIFLSLPLLFDIFQKHVKPIYLNIVLGIMLLWGSAIDINRIFGVDQRVQFPLPDLKTLTLNNIDKSPTAIVGGWGSPLYSTKWKYLYYNVYDTYNYSRGKKIEDRIKDSKPEVLIDIVNVMNKKMGFQTYINNNYQAIDSNSRIWIDKQKISQWDLENIN